MSDMKETAAAPFDAVPNDWIKRNFDKPAAPDSVNGWTPPIIYDVSTDSSRIVTQDDVDGLVAVAQEYGRILREMRNTVNFADMRIRDGWKR